MITGSRRQIPTVEENSQASLQEEFLFNEDVTLDEHGNANMSWHCAGVRASSPRSMLMVI